MPDKFRKFEDPELEIVFEALTEHFVRGLFEAPNPVTAKLLDQISHERLQRKHAEARQLVVA